MNGQVSLGTILREWGRVGCLGFGGPPAHIAMIRERAVDERKWISADRFEDAVAACNLLPGPASTQLMIFTAWSLRGTAGAVIGGLAFILPGLIAILALAALFLGDPPDWVRGAGGGAGSAVAAVAVQAGWALVGPSWERTASRPRWIAYLVAGGIAAALAGPWVVLVLLAAGAVEVIIRRGSHSAASVSPLPFGVLLAAGTGGIGALAWVALQVGALSYGGGFVIIPLMQDSAVETYGWLTEAEFLNAVALGQVTPGPVVHTVAVVGYGAAGLGGALLASVIAFSPSFAFILLGASRFEDLRGSETVQAFLGGAGPAAIGAILGIAVPLALALTETWQFAILTASAVALLVARLGIVTTLLGAGIAGAAIVLAGGPIPS